MKLPRIRWDLVAGALLVALLAVMALNRHAIADRDARLEELRTEALELRLDSAGWETRLVGATANLEELLQEAGDSLELFAAENADLARQVEELGGELRAVATMYAELAGSIEAHDATVHGPPAAPDSISAGISDGLLEGRLVYRPPATLAIDPYHVRLALALGWVEAPDGRALLTARAQDPRVALSFGDVYYQAPAPVEFCGFGAKVKAGVVGGASVELVRVLLDALLP